MRFDLSDEEWAVIQPLLPHGGRSLKRVDDRRVLNGIFYILRTGARGAIYPNATARAPLSTTAMRAGRGAAYGRRSSMGLPGAPAKACSSSTHPSSRLTARQPAQKGELAQDIGRSRGGRTSKVHAVVGEHGRPRRLVITGGQVHDGQVLPDLLEGAGAPLAVVADKAYGSRAIRQLIADGEALAVILSKSNAREPFPHDPGLYKMRNIVERFFCTMKDMRRLATRFEKLSRNFLAMIHIFAIRLWIN